MALRRSFPGVKRQKEIAEEQKQEIKEASAETVKKVFRGFDVDASGTMTRDDMLKVFSLLVPTRKAEDWSRLFDASGSADADLGTVDYGAFIEYLCQHQEKGETISLLLSHPSADTQMSFRLSDKVSELCEAVGEATSLSMRDQNLVAYGEDGQSVELQPSLTMREVSAKLGGRLARVEALPEQPPPLPLQRLLSRRNISEKVMDGPMAEISVNTIIGESCQVIVSTTSKLAEVIEHCAEEFGWPAKATQLLNGGVLLKADSTVGDIPGLEAPDYSQDLLAIRVELSTKARTVVLEGAGSEQWNGTYQKKPRTPLKFSYRCTDPGRRKQRITFYHGAGQWPAAWYVEDENANASYWAVPDQDFDFQCTPDLPMQGWLPWTGKRSAGAATPGPDIIDGGEADEE